MNNYISVEKEFHMSCVQMLKDLGYYYDGKEWVTLQEHCCDKPPAPCEEDERGFEDLVYVEPTQYCHIKVKSLTSDQKEFLEDLLRWDDGDRFDHMMLQHLTFSPVSKSWSFWSDCRSVSTVIGFNDIFKYKESL